jgi:hypothetical protein
VHKQLTCKAEARRPFLVFERANFLLFQATVTASRRQLDAVRMVGERHATRQRQRSGVTITGRRQAARGTRQRHRVTIASARAHRGITSSAP